MNLRVRFEEVFDRRALVRRKIVGDHVDLFATRLVNHDVSEKGNELRRGVPLGSFAPALLPVGVLKAAYSDKVPGR